MEYLYLLILNLLIRMSALRMESSSVWSTAVSLCLEQDLAQNWCLVLTKQELANGSLWEVALTLWFEDREEGAGSEGILGTGYSKCRGCYGQYIIFDLNQLD